VTYNSNFGISEEQKKKSYILGLWDEATGILIDFDEKQCLIKFESFSLQIEPRGLECISFLRSLSGKKVSILKTDDKEKFYKISVQRHSKLTQDHESLTASSVGGFT